MHARTRIGAAAAATLIAAMAAGCTAANGPAPSSSVRAVAPSTSATASAPPDERPIPSFVPRDYVMIDPAEPARLIVRATLTGAVAATLDAPHGTIFTGVYGSGSAGVFAVTARWIVPTAGGGEFWYLLRLRAGVPAPLKRLPFGHVGGDPTAAALSPDGSLIAMAFTYRTSPPHPQPLTLYRVATGAVLRTWTVTSGIISAADPMANGDLGQEAGNIGMRWTADGRGLAFAFHANTAPGKDGYGYDRMASIRLLDTTAPGGDLIANSHELTSASPQYNPGNGAGTQCLASSGWSLSSDGRAVTCAAEWTSPGAQPPASPRAAACASQPAGASAIPQQRNLGFWRQFSLPGAAGAETIYGVCVAGSIQLDWASPDGTTVLGSLAGPGHSSFGLFSHGAFHELPPPPAGVPSALIAW